MLLLLLLLWLLLLLSNLHRFTFISNLLLIGVTTVRIILWNDQVSVVTVCLSSTATSVVAAVIGVVKLMIIITIIIMTVIQSCDQLEAPGLPHYEGAGQHEIINMMSGRHYVVGCRVQGYPAYRRWNNIVFINIIIVVVVTIIMIIIPLCDCVQGPELPHHKGAGPQADIGLQRRHIHDQKLNVQR